MQFNRRLFYAFIALVVMRVWADGEIEVSFDLSRNVLPTGVAESSDRTVWVSFEFAGVDRYALEGRFQNRTLKPSRGTRLLMLILP
jgi:hypothetical protein